LGVSTTTIYNLARKGEIPATRVGREWRFAGFFEEPRHPAIYLLDTRWKQMHSTLRVREGTVTITGSHPHSRWSLCAQGHSILSQYQASYPAILDIATYVSLNTLFGCH
jgi:hypothetical protein